MLSPILYPASNLSLTQSLSLILALILTPPVTQILNLIPFQTPSHPSLHLHIYHQLQHRQSFPYPDAGTRYYPTLTLCRLHFVLGAGSERIRCLLHTSPDFISAQWLSFRLTEPVWLSVCPQSQNGCFKGTQTPAEAGRGKTSRRSWSVALPLRPDLQEEVKFALSELSCRRSLRKGQ